jgi:hypothetical protein
LLATGVAAAGAAPASAHSNAAAIATRAKPPMRRVPCKMRRQYKQPDGK